MNNTDKNTHPIAVSVNEAARLLSVSRSTMRNLLKEGAIRYRKISANERTLVSVESLHKFMGDIQ